MDRPAAPSRLGEPLPEAPVLDQRSAPPAQARDEKHSDEKRADESPTEQPEAPPNPEADVRAHDSVPEMSGAEDYGAAYSESRGEKRETGKEEAEAQAPTVDSQETEPAFTEAESPEAPLSAKNLADGDVEETEGREAEGKEAALENEAVPGEETATEPPAVADDLAEESLPEESLPEEPVIPPSRSVAMHVRGDGHLADNPEETDSGEGDLSHDKSVPEAEAARKKEGGSHQEDKEPVDLLWPDDEDAPAMPASAFQVIGQDEFPVDAWPHPSTWAIPGTSWEELNEPIAKETDVEAEDER